VGLDTAGWVLNAIGEMIRDGRYFVPGDRVTDDAGRYIRLSKVHPRHFEQGLFAAWVDYYDCLGPPHPEPEALEVVLPGRKALLASARSSIG
jgi:hypothetical protein